MNDCSIAQNNIAVMMTIYCNDRLDYFIQALESVLEQDLVGYDMRVYLYIDGEIPDAYESYVQEHRQLLYRILRDDVNRGLAVGLNRLIEVLEDECYVFRMDADDIAHPSRFRKQIEYLESNPDVSLVGCQAWDIDDLGQRVGERDYPVSAHEIASAMPHINPVLHPTICVRRELYYESFARYPEAYLTEDWAFLIMLHTNGVRMGNVPERLFNWRVGESFFDRRKSVRRGMTELRWSAFVVYKDYGIFSYRYIFSLMKFILRCVPVSVARMIYQSSIRSYFT